ncbi:hypothetical protein [Raineya orbicola]|uniref:DUF2490 domain-containing protein n=1 Tax=Raineya orbicola TaxID=2016530 RepID=A0A2N3IJ10_9BACT|nr:hypothetical protein [Raineya orbicola]PKQ70322.1 hypothetical protein Rain11_0701 [Raineya orbicola]
MKICQKLAWAFCGIFLVIRLQAQDSLHLLPYFEWSGGLRYAYAFTNNWAVQRLPDETIRYEKQERNNFGIALQSRLMASNVLHFLQILPENRRWRVGDVFISELQIGFCRKQIEQESKLILGYHFGIGVGASYQVNNLNAVGFYLVPLKFSNDGVSPAISGSWVGLRWANPKIWIEMGLESRDLSFLGYLVPATLNPRQYFGQVVWQKKWGLRTEWAYNNFKDKIYGGTYENFFLAILLFYGKFF